MKILIAGLGRMGGQIARKLVEAGHQVGAYNRSRDKIDEAVQYGATAVYEKSSAKDWFASNRAVVWVMVPASAVAAELKDWCEVLPAGSILVDGGNSDFRLTKINAVMVQAAGHTLLDSGTSGGVWGYTNGFSMMLGGDSMAFDQLKPALDTLAAPHGGYQWFGDSGAGHYVKMVHNAIEYGMMESLAEGYRMLKEGPYQSLDLAAAGNVWQQGSVVNSWLNELTRQALVENKDLVGIDGVVAESGEARWALEVANELGILLPAIQTSFAVRLASQKGEISFATKLLAAMRNKFGGHSLNV